MENRNTISPTILLVLVCFALSSTARAVVPPPDGGYPGNNTAEGDNALLSLTTGVDNIVGGVIGVVGGFIYGLDRLETQSNRFLRISSLAGRTKSGL
jgi:hypothetical protein